MSPKREVPFSWHGRRNSELLIGLCLERDGFPVLGTGKKPFPNGSALERQTISRGWSFGVLPCPETLLIWSNSGIRFFGVPG